MRMYLKNHGFEIFFEAQDTFIVVELLSEISGKQKFKQTGCR